MDTYTSFLNYMIQEQKISRNELMALSGNDQNSFDPKTVTAEMQAWCTTLGITQVTGRPLTLSPCPFSEEELRLMHQKNEMLICIPKGLTLQEMANLFRLESWAVKDPLVVSRKEKEDLWLKTSASPTPAFMGITGIEMKQLAEKNNWVLFSLLYYMAFIARFCYLFQKKPDYRYWIWLPKGRYDRSGMLIAGFDGNDHFNVHGWMPHFSASFLGARYLEAKN